MSTDYTYSVFVIALCISFRLILITLMIILTTCICSLVLLQTTTFDKIETNRSIYAVEADTQKTLVYAKQIVQLLLITVSKDEKPLSFLHSNISFGTLIRK